jgi:hypothetical protein
MKSSEENSRSSFVCEFKPIISETLKVNKTGK